MTQTEARSALFERRSHVGIVTLNRPGVVNAVDADHTS
jgi:enoyl-CoA hydratase/carnithine racemase